MLVLLQAMWCDTAQDIGDSIKTLMINSWVYNTPLEGFEYKLWPTFSNLCSSHRPWKKSLADSLHTLCHFCWFLKETHSLLHTIQKKNKKLKITVYQLILKIDLDFKLSYQVLLSSDQLHTVNVSLPNYIRYCLSNLCSNIHLKRHTLCQLLLYSSAWQRDHDLKKTKQKTLV